MVAPLEGQLEGRHAPGDVELERVGGLGQGRNSLEDVLARRELAVKVEPVGVQGAIDAVRIGCTHVSPVGGGRPLSGTVAIEDKIGWRRLAAYREENEQPTNQNDTLR